MTEKLDMTLLVEGRVFLETKQMISFVRNGFQGKALDQSLRKVKMTLGDEVMIPDLVEKTRAPILILL